MTDSPKPARDQQGPDTPDRRALFELEERVEELTAQLNTRIEAERIHELELSSIGRDLAVTKAYNEMLEKAAAQQQEIMRLTHQHIRNIDRIHLVDLPAAQARAQRAEDDRDTAIHQRNLVAQDLQAALDRADQSEALLAVFSRRRAVRIVDKVSRNPLARIVRPHRKTPGH
ncbi:hypothetical protein D1871_20000 [Nakamurella silvestris]|nr:hypothetical protein D1871_20000 [Nakamurella silvestris]